MAGTSPRRDLHLTELLRNEPDVPSGLERDRGGRAAGEHDPARLELELVLGGEAARGGERAERVAEDRGGRADLDRASVDLHDHSEVREIEMWIAPRADDE